MKKLGNGKKHVKYKDRTGCNFCMIKIGVEIPDEKFAGVDLSNPELGNPGVGGSEYLFTLLASQLKKRGLDITIYHYSENALPDGSCDYIVKDSIDMLKKANFDGMDILIHQVGKTTEWYQTLEKTSIKSVAWSHVYLDYDELKDVRKCNNVKRVVFVGKEEYDSYIDDDVIKKSTYIFNMIPMESAAAKRELNKRIITYVGSLVPAKGFHKLAQIWPDIIKKVPDAELYVLGNGKVYDRNAKLGKFGISQEDYENSFMKYLTDDKEAILPSVHFLGIVGNEKVDIFKKTAVGVVNPTALTETFCVSAVEMEYAYVPVISRKKWGLLDTVDDGKTGYLFSNSSDFIEKMVCLLNNEELNQNMGKKAHEFVKDNFDMNRIIPLWISLIDEIDKDIPVKYLGVQKNWSNDYKWIKGCIRFFRFNMSLVWLPSFHDLKNMLKKTLKGKN